MKNKKLLFPVLITSALLILGLLIYLLFFVFYPSKNTFSFKNVIPELLIYPTIDNSNQKLLFFNIDQKKDLAFYSFSLTNQEEQNISAQMSIPNTIIWSPKKDKVLIQIIYDKYIFEKLNSPFKSYSLKDKQETTWLYDFSNEKYFMLDPNIQNVSWINNDKIIYSLYDLAKNTNGIFTSDPDGTNATKITDVDFTEGIKFTPINENTVLYSPVLYETKGNNIYKLDIQTGQTTELISNKSAGQVLDVSSQDKIIYQTYDAKNNIFGTSLINQDGSKNKNLNIDGISTKAVFSEQGDIAVVAIKKDDSEADILYKINPENGKKTKIKFDLGDLQLNIENLMISSDNKTLYFTSNDILYSLDLR